MPDMFTIVLTLGIAFFVVLQFILNVWVYRLQREVEKQVPKSDVPESFKDRAEVTLWQTISSALLTVLIASGMSRLIWGAGLEPHLGLTILAVALSIKTIPSYRWLRRYKSGKFNV